MEEREEGATGQVKRCGKQEDCDNGVIHLRQKNGRREKKVKTVTQEGRAKATNAKPASQLLQW